MQLIVCFYKCSHVLKNKQLNGCYSIFQPILQLLKVIASFLKSANIAKLWSLQHEMCTNILKCWLLRSALLLQQITCNCWFNWNNFIFSPYCFTSDWIFQMSIFKPSPILYMKVCYLNHFQTHRGIHLQAYTSYIVVEGYSC